MLDCICRANICLLVKGRAPLLYFFISTKMNRLIIEYPWAKTKGYAHIDLPLSDKETRSYCKSILDPNWVAKYAFLPLIRFDNKLHPYRVDKGSTSQKKRKRTTKIRTLMYASHVDSLIYSYYAYQLATKYEEWIKNNGLDSNILAYRKIPVSNEEDAAGKSNIHFAKDVFAEIESRSHHSDSVEVMTFDIKGFFDNLNHAYLKEVWKRLAGVDEEAKLFVDHYRVFRNVTNYAYVYKQDLFDLFKERIICRKKCTPWYKGKLYKKKITRLRYLRDHNAIAFCKRSDIKEIRSKGLIITRKNEFKEATKAEACGIPQGLPISAVLANAYMMEFDKIINELVSKLGGSYYRYSDDIVVLCDSDKADQISAYILNQIKEVKLEIQPHKVARFNFNRYHDGILKCLYRDNQVLNQNKKLEYLGFSFDGQYIRIKDAGIGHYYYKMDRAFRRATRYASNMHGPFAQEIFMSSLIRRFTRAGQRAGKSRTGKRKMGNYHAYINKADSIIGDDSIKKQMSKNLTRFSRNVKISRRKLLRARYNYEQYKEAKY